MLKKPSPTPFLLRKDLYRIWFEFLNLAQSSRVATVQTALKSSAVRYKEWGDVRGVSFDKWWKTHSHLFTEATVRELKDSSERQLQDSLLIEVPLNESSRVLVKKIKEIIDYELKVRSSTNSVKSKRKILVTKDFVPTKGVGHYAEPKLAVLREVLNVYKNVYCVNRDLRGRRLLDKTHDYYKSRAVNKEIPISIRNAKTAKEVTLSLRNLRRWITWAQRIEFNVANGQFPGDYL